MWSGNIGLAIRNLVKEKEKFIEEVEKKKKKKFFFFLIFFFFFLQIDNESNGS